MCGRFVLVSDLATVTEEFQVGEVRGDYSPLHEAYPGQEIYAVMGGSVNLLQPCRWGLIPAWSNHNLSGKKLINARAETLAEKPSFRGLFKRQRCLIIADGFYEWDQSKRKASPHYYHLMSGRPFGMAGLYDIRRDPDGRVRQTCTIVTTSSNDLVRPLHDRMPAIVPKADEALWLDPSVSDPRRLLPLLRPYPSDAMAFQPGF